MNQYNSEDFPLDDTITIRRFFKLKPTPKFGEGVFRTSYKTPPVILIENGWTFLARSKKHRDSSYLRSPDPLATGPFPVNVRIPSDEAIETLARDLFSRHPNGWYGKLGMWRGVFHPSGAPICGTYWLYLLRRGREREALSPMLGLSWPGVWLTTLRCHDGLDAPPTWDRSQYFSQLVPKSYT